MDDSPRTMGDALAEIERLAHEYHSYSASALGLRTRMGVVDRIHKIAVAALGRQNTDSYPADDECPD